MQSQCLGFMYKPTFRGYLVGALVRGVGIQHHHMTLILSFDLQIDPDF